MSEIKYAVAKQDLMHKFMNVKREMYKYLDENNLKYDIEKWMEVCKKYEIPENYYRFAKENAIRRNEPLKMDR